MQCNVKPKDTALIELNKDMERHNADVHRLQWEASEQGKRGYETAIDSLCKALSEIEKQTAKNRTGCLVMIMVRIGVLLTSISSIKTIDYL